MVIFIALHYNPVGRWAMPNPRHAIRSFTRILCCSYRRAACAMRGTCSSSASRRWCGSLATGDGISPFLWHKKPVDFLGFNPLLGEFSSHFFGVETSIFLIFHLKFFIKHPNSSVVLGRPGHNMVSRHQGWASCCLGESFGRSCWRFAVQVLWSDSLDEMEISSRVTLIIVLIGTTFMGSVRLVVVLN